MPKSTSLEAHVGNWLDGMSKSEEIKEEQLGNIDDSDRLSPSQSPDGSAGKTHSPVYDTTASYRKCNLNFNKIRLISRNELVPTHIATQLHALEAAGDSPPPDVHEVTQNFRRLYIDGATGLEVETYLTDIFPEIDARYPPVSVLARTWHEKMAPCSLPSISPCFRINTPKPHILYGYNFDDTSGDNTDDDLLDTVLSRNILVPRSELALPFLSVYVGGDGPEGTDSVWVMVNRCMAASACCVVTAEHINIKLKDLGISEKYAVETHCFGVVTTQREARLCVMWREEDGFCCMEFVECLALCREKDYLDLRNRVRNIFKWALGERLEKRKAAVDVIIDEEKRRQTE